MTTMTIHADDTFAVALRAYARNLGKSVNQTVKDVFAPILGLAEAEGQSPWARFYGAGVQMDGEAWEREISDMRQVDAEMWR